MVAFAGAGPWPQITSVRPLRTSLSMIGTSPPGPLRWGSTTCSVKAVAAAASKALPPFSSVAMPTAVAIQCVEATTPKVPSISGRVVNGLGLMTLMLLHCHPDVAAMSAFTPVFDALCRPSKDAAEVPAEIGNRFRSFPSVQVGGRRLGCRRPSRLAPLGPQGDGTIVRGLSLWLLGCRSARPGRRRHELQCDTVHAVAQAGGFGAIVED